MTTDPQTHPIPYTPNLPDVAAYVYVPRYRGVVPKRMHELDEAAQRLLRRVDEAIEVLR